MKAKVYKKIISQREIETVDYDAVWIDWRGANQIALPPRKLVGNLKNLVSKVQLLVPDKLLNFARFDRMTKTQKKGTSLELPPDLSEHLLVIPAGNFRGGKIFLAGKQFYLDPGSVLLINFHRGEPVPSLQVGKIHSGIRYSLVLGIRKRK